MTKNNFFIENLYILFAIVPTLDISNKLYLSDMVRPFLMGFIRWKILRHKSDPVHSDLSAIA